MAPEDLGRLAKHVGGDVFAYLREPMFWFVTVGAAAFRSVTAEPRTTGVVAVSFFSAVFAAITFTEPVVEYGGFKGSHVWAVAALITLTGEHVMRFIIKITKDPSQILDLWNKWRGRA